MMIAVMELKHDTVRAERGINCLTNAEKVLIEKWHFYIKLEYEV